MQHFDASQVREFLPIGECIEAMAEAMKAVSSGSVTLPPRTYMPAPQQSAFLVVMPGCVLQPNILGLKVLTLYPHNPQSDLPTLQGFVALFDPMTGAPLAMIDGVEVTRIRTAAVSALATRELARQNAKSLGILGCGVQAHEHIDAIAAVRPVNEIRVWGRSYRKAVEFAALHAARTGNRVSAVRDAADAASCDIVCTVTRSREPVIRGAWVQPGAHVNLVGGHSADTREADSALVSKSRVYVDSRVAAAIEAGDLLVPRAAGEIDEGHVVGELGELLLQKIGGRRDQTEITVFKSLGLAAQDLLAAWYVLQRARAVSS